jgi:hypothetical protein
METSTSVYEHACFKLVMNGASLPDEYEAEVINHGLSKH